MRTFFSSPYYQIIGFHASVMCINAALHFVNIDLHRSIELTFTYLELYSYIHKLRSKNWTVYMHVLYALCSLLQALCQLYFDPDMEHKDVAQKWLTQAQASAQAWQFCWALLSPAKVCCHSSALQLHIYIRLYSCDH